MVALMWRFQRVQAYLGYPLLHDVQPGKGNTQYFACPVIDTENDRAALAVRHPCNHVGHRRAPRPDDLRPLK